MIIDVHTHTNPKSDDSLLSPAELIYRAKQAGLDGICLTEHDWFWDAESVARLCQEHDFLVLPGVELTAEEGHFLVFGLEKYVFGMHHASFLKGMVDEAGGAMILAHPYRRQFRVGDTSDGYQMALERACENQAFLLADAVEVLNGRGREEENGFSLELSQRLKLKGTGGSDAHSVSDIGTCATRFERRISNVKEFITELREGRFRPTNLRKGS